MATPAEQVNDALSRLLQIEETSRIGITSPKLNEALSAAKSRALQEATKALEAYAAENPKNWIGG